VINQTDGKKNSYPIANACNGEVSISEEKNNKI
jgi:hypothetical protein